MTRLEQTPHRCHPAHSAYYWVALLWTCLAPLDVFGACPTPQTPALAIVIDDIGYSLQQGKAAATLPFPVTLAVLPYTPHAMAVSALARQHNKEVMIHLPMSSLNRDVSDPLTLTEQLTPEAFDLLLGEALRAVPGARGVNNHMGSSLTGNRPAMTRLMRRLREENLFFIDSRTSPDTVAATVAGELKVPHTSRDVFLDHTRTSEAIAVALGQAVNLALETGSALAIGHPYAETLALLEAQLPLLPEPLRIASASELVACHANELKPAQVAPQGQTEQADRP